MKVFFLVFKRVVFIVKVFFIFRGFVCIFFLVGVGRGCREEGKFFVKY